MDGLIRRWEGDVTEKSENFTNEIIDQIKYYVYRLIDPRNGETFYVGKGRGNRIFAHVKLELGNGSDMVSDKLQRIRDIRNAGCEVQHVIHRHGMEDEKTAEEVEAALIDAYPAAANLVRGRGSIDRGVMHVKQIVNLYQAQEVVFEHKALVINVSRSADEENSLYDAVRYAWKLDRKKAAKAEIVLAASQGLVIGVFIADKWLPALREHFPNGSLDIQGRSGFVGHEAPKEIADRYLQKRLPDWMRKRGAANPIKYSWSKKG
jgi:uncharacterized protein